MSAKRRQPGTGKPWPDLRRDREWCVVYQVCGYWRRQYFWAKSREEAEIAMPDVVRRCKNKELWKASDIAARDKAETDAENAELDRRIAAKKREYKPLPLPEVKPVTEAERQCRCAQYQAIKRAHAAGLPLLWISKELRAQLEAFKERPIFGEIYGGDPKESGGKPSHHRLLVRHSRNGDTSPGWENAVRAYEEMDTPR